METPKLDPEHIQRLQKRRDYIRLTLEAHYPMSFTEVEELEKELDEIESIMFTTTEFLHLPAKDYGK